MFRKRDVVGCYFGRWYTRIWIFNTLQRRMKRHWCRTHGDVLYMSELDSWNGEGLVMDGPSRLNRACAITCSPAHKWWIVPAWRRGTGPRENITSPEDKRGVIPDAITEQWVRLDIFPRSAFSLSKRNLIVGRTFMKTTVACKTYWLMMQCKAIYLDFCLCCAGICWL